MKNSLRPPTIKDVARRAGVNPSTVSRVLNNRLHMPISPATIERIRQAARELEYTPHAAARALVARHTHTIGFICFQINSPLYSEMAQAVQSLLEERGYHLIVCSASGRSEREAFYARLLTEGRVDGVLVVGSTGASQEVVRQLRCARRIPIVAAGSPLLPETTNLLTGCAAYDNVRGGYLVGEHLGRLGHRRVGYLGAGGTVGGYHSTLRLEGLRQGLAAAEVDEPVRIIEADGDPYEVAAPMMEELLRRDPDLTAIFAGNDRRALAALQALWRTGRQVPQEVSVVGFQDLPFAAYTIPALTTVRIPVAQIAQRATEMLFRALEGHEIAPREVTIEPELVVRESTAPPRGD